MKIKSPEAVVAFLKKHRLPALWTCFGLLGLLIVWVGSPSNAESAPVREAVELSTFIPQGFTLIPIDLKGAEKLDGVLGSHGIVDLYESQDLPGSRPRLVGRRLRLIRAPMNPQAFAVLVRESEAERILSFQGPFMASVLPTESAAHEVTSAAARGPKIEFQSQE